MRAVVYDRVSVRDEGSQTEHLRRCWAFCETQGWTVEQAYTDTASGFRRDVVRVGWESVRGMVERREVDAVVVFSVSRAGRNVASLLKFVEDCTDANVVFASATEPINTSGPMGLVFISILGALAQMESLTKSERALLGRTVAARAGTWSGGRRPYGFRPVQTTDGIRLEVDAEEATHIRAAAESMLNGTSLNGAAALMNGAGARTIGGREWAAADVGALLERESNSPAILTARTLTRVQRAVEQRRRGTRRPRYLLTGLAFCGRCGAKLKGKPVNGVPRYVCAEGSLHLSILAAVADEEVGQACSNMTLAQPETVPNPADAPAALAAEVAEVERRLEVLGGQVETGELSEAAFRGRERQLSARAAELEARIEQVTPRHAFAALLDPEDVPAGEVRAWLETLVERVVIKPGRTDRVEVHAREGVRATDGRARRHG